MYSLGLQSHLSSLVMAAVYTPQPSSSEGALLRPYSVAAIMLEILP